MRKPGAAIYDRVSTFKQEAGATRQQLRAAAEARGCRVVLDIEEVGTGARNDRPGLQQVLQAARRGQVQEVYVYRLDRFGRSTLDLLTNIQQLRDFGGKFFALKQGLSMTGHDAFSNFMLAVLAGVAEYERELISDRTIVGLERARSRGVVLGRPRGELPDSGTVLQLRRAGETWQEIADLLDCSIAAARRALDLGAAKKGTKTPRREMA